MQVFTAPDSIKTPAFLTPEGTFDNAAYVAEEDRYLGELTALALSHDPHPLAGKLVSVPFADGQASYVVAKVNGKVSLIHAAAGDAWRDARFERTATVKELRELIAGAERMRALFGGR
jgi:hypothetical protein